MVLFVCIFDTYILEFRCHKKHKLKVWFLNSLFCEIVSSNLCKEEDRSTYQRRTQVHQNHILIQFLVAHLQHGQEVYEIDLLYNFFTFEVYQQFKINILFINSRYFHSPVLQPLYVQERCSSRHIWFPRPVPYQTIRRVSKNYHIGNKNGRMVWCVLKRILCVLPSLCPWIRYQSKNKNTLYSIS